MVYSRPYISSVSICLFKSELAYVSVLRLQYVTLNTVHTYGVGIISDKISRRYSVGSVDVRVVLHS